MIYVGVDIAKLNHFTSVISSDGEILIESFKFTNDADGFQILVSKHISLNVLPDSIIDLESTTHYGYNIVRYLVAENSSLQHLRKAGLTTMPWDIVPASSSESSGK